MASYLNRDIKCSICERYTELSLVKSIKILLRITILFG